MYSIYETYIVPASILIPLFIALFNYKFLDKPLIIIVLFLIGSAIFNLVGIVMANYAIPNLWVFHFYNIFEFALVSWFYNALFKYKFNKVIFILIAILTVLCLINLIFVQKNMQFNTYTRSLEAIIVIGYCIVFFNQQSQRMDEYNWSAESFNWINVGFLVYFAGTFFTYLFSNYLVLGNDRKISRIIWTVQDTILIIEYLLFAVGFYKCRKQPTTSLY